MEVANTAAPQAPESVVTPETTPAPAPPQVSPQFQALAKKEQAIVRMQRELKAKQEELAGKETLYKSWEEKKAKAKTSPLEALQELGLSYEEITQYILNDKKPTADMEVKSVREELQAMREQQEQRLKDEREAQEAQNKQAQEQQITQFKADLGDYLTTNADKFELLNLEGEEGVELVYDTIMTDWQNKTKAYNDAGRVGRPPKVISTEEAAELVEKFMEEKFETALTKSKKLGSRYSRAPEVADPAAPPSAPMSVGKTLNNGLIQPSSPSSLPPKNEQERIARALIALG